MIHTVKARSGLPYTVVWFPDVADVDAVARLRLPITVVRQASAAFMRRYEQPLLRRLRFCTAVADLTQSEDRLMANMSKTCRASIRHGLRTPHVFEVLKPSESPQGCALIDEFNRRLYGQPVSAANWRLTERHGVLTQIRVDGQLLAVNTHLFDGTARARAFYGATIPRQQGHTPPRVVADINRVLTWYDMTYFRSLGVRTYDAGGLFDDPDHPSAGVDRFKLAFGYARRYEYHALTSRYLLARRGLKLLARDS
ncbi:hypothetical protein E7T09_21175 [Deinococcus sp. KSM4-11]|uniref:hypothetical protein n=1 Tax=Deinococcus sp. KSM4-11 TaxID=2568654 RepID=UPI0010A503AA|nr:hypothetical protein [Deinococcus sp. KSM4-11]THF84021.1 hypothetical protein E7T09_21175 [Deinococcus sp. KSM4-11]